MFNTIPNMNPITSFQLTGCAAHLLDCPRLFNSDDYDFFFIRGNDGAVIKMHVTSVCNVCVKKIVRFMANE